jgi:putative hydrolase of the HAD superfamily
LQTHDQQPIVSLPYQTKAILFDLDDTLFDRTKVFRTWATSFVQTRLVLNKDTSEEEIINFIITTDDRGYTSRIKLFSQIRRAFPSLQEATGVLIEQYYQHQLARLELTEGASMLLQALQAAHIPIGIVTNGRAWQLQKVKGLGLDQFTSCIFVSEMVGAKKPDASIFLAAASHLQTPPENILFVGDHPYNDIWGAHNVGMHTAWLNRTQVWPETLSSSIADLTIASLAELQTLLSVPASSRANEPQRDSK